MKKYLFICLSCLLLGCTQKAIQYEKKPVPYQDKVIRENNTKSVKTIEYQYKIGSIDSSSFKILAETEYNKDGKKLKEIVYSNSLFHDSEGVYYYDYKDNGNYERVLIDFDNNLLNKVIEECDENNIYSLTCYDKAGNIFSKDVFKYDSIGLKERKRFDERGRLLLTLLRTNNKDNIKEYSAKKGKKTLSITTDKYNNREQIIETSSQILSDNMKITKKIEYHENGLEKNKVCYNTLEVPECIYVFEYEKWEEEEV